MIRRLLRALRCWRQQCPGRVVSGWRGDELYIGWCCNDCGKVTDYEPAGLRYRAGWRPRHAKEVKP